MSKRKRTAAILGIILLISGIMITLVSYNKGGMAQLTAKDSEYISIIGNGDIVETEAMKLSSFSSIDIKLDCGDITFKTGDDYSIILNDFIPANLESCKVDEGTLYLDYHDETEGVWLNFNFTGNNRRSGIVVTVPSSANMSNISLNTGDGSVKVAQVAVESLSVESSYGSNELKLIDCNTFNFQGNWSNLKLNDIQAEKSVIKGIDGCEAINLSGGVWQFSCTGGSDGFKLNDLAVKELAVTNDYGDITVGDIVAAKVDITSKDGAVTLDRADLDAAVLISEYGSITMSDSKTAALKVNSDDGDITLESDFTGISDIASTYGNIVVKVLGDESAYSYSLKTQYGEAKVDGHSVSADLTRLKEVENSISCVSSDGDIAISFQK